MYCSMSIRCTCSHPIISIDSYIRFLLHQEIVPGGERIERRKPLIHNNATVYCTVVHRTESPSTLKYTSTHSLHHPICEEPNCRSCRVHDSHLNNNVDIRKVYPQKMICKIVNNSPFCLTWFCNVFDLQLVFKLRWTKTMLRRPNESG